MRLEDKWNAGSWDELGVNLRVGGLRPRKCLTHVTSFTKEPRKRNLLHHKISVFKKTVYSPNLETRKPGKCDSYLWNHNKPTDSLTGVTGETRASNKKSIPFTQGWVLKSPFFASFLVILLDNIFAGLVILVNNRARARSVMRQISNDTLSLKLPHPSQEKIILRRRENWTKSRKTYWCGKLSRKGEDP